ncbi:MAG: hypothetical protein G5663_07675 [Serratia symbiotica]|nr:hypothetical protein [Serratia symbiotica]
MAMPSVLMLKRICRPDILRPPGLRRLHFYNDKSTVELAQTTPSRLKTQRRVKLRTSL